MPETLTVPLFPLPGIVLFPGVRMPFYIFEPRYRAMLTEVLDGAGIVGVPMLLPGYEAGEGGRPPISPVFGLGRVADYDTHPDGTSHVLISGKHRARMVQEVPSAPFRRAVAEVLEDRPVEEEDGPALRERLRQAVARLVPLGLTSEAKEALEEILGDGERDIGVIVNLLATVVIGNSQVRQNLLEEDDVAARGRHVLTVLETQGQMWSPGYRGREPETEDER